MATEGIHKFRDPEGMFHTRISLANPDDPEDKMEVEYVTKSATARVVSHEIKKGNEIKLVIENEKGKKLSYMTLEEIEKERKGKAETSEKAEKEENGERVEEKEEEKPAQKAGGRRSVSIERMEKEKAKEEKVPPKARAKRGRGKTLTMRKTPAKKPGQRGGAIVKEEGKPASRGRGRPSGKSKEAPKRKDMPSRTMPPKEEEGIFAFPREGVSTRGIGRLGTKKGGCDPDVENLTIPQRTLPEGGKALAPRPAKRTRRY